MEVEGTEKYQQHWRPGEPFTLGDLSKLEEDLAKHYPNNNGLTINSVKFCFTFEGSFY